MQMLESPFDHRSLLLVDVIPPLGEEADFCPDHLSPNKPFDNPLTSSSKQTSEIRSKFVYLLSSLSFVTMLSRM